jgi:TfoX/Sxy family transcriptional regulator of competence genes
MVDNQQLVDRILVILSGTPGLEEKRMFGGVGFMVNGNMACGVNKSDLIVRVGPESYAEALAEENVKEFDMTGRPMTGWVVVNEQGYLDDKDLQGWVDRGVAFARSLPEK